MQHKSLEILDRQIEGIRQAMAGLGPMRPGTLTRQYRNPHNREGGFWQLSYTHQAKSHTEYVRENQVDIVREEVAEFRKFKKLAARWVELALRRSQTRSRQARAQSNPAPSVARNPRKTAPQAPGAPNIQPPT